MITRALHRGLVPALVYLAALLAIAFWPTPVDAGARGTLASVLDWLHARGVPQAVNYGVIEFGANIVLFIPLGLLLGHWLSSRWVALIAAVGTSVVIEAGQWLLLPERVPSWTDVLANSCGALLGLLLWSLFSRHRRRGHDSVRRSARHAGR